MIKMRELYEEHAKAVFENKGKEKRKKLGFRSIPWPYPPGKSVSDIEGFLFSGLDRTSTEFKKGVRSQQVRWHPDRFLQKVGDRLKDEDRERIMEKVKEISQRLNALLND